MPSRGSSITLKGLYDMNGINNNDLYNLGIIGKIDRQKQSCRAAYSVHGNFIFHPLHKKAIYPTRYLLLRYEASQ